MDENEIAAVIVDAAFKIHCRFGPGLLESVYLGVLAHELRRRGLRVELEKAIRLEYEDLVFEEAFRADLIVEEKVIVELKSVAQTAPVHKKQLLTYLRLTGLKLGLLINFGETVIRTGITRVVNGL